MLCLYIIKSMYPQRLTPCSLVGDGAGLGWLVLVFCERETLLVGGISLAETNKRTRCKMSYNLERMG